MVWTERLYWKDYDSGSFFDYKNSNYNWWKNKKIKSFRFGFLCKYLRFQIPAWTKHVWNSRFQAFLGHSREGKPKFRVIWSHWAFRLLEMLRDTATTESSSVFFNERLFSLKNQMSAVNTSFLPWKPTKLLKLTLEVNLKFLKPSQRDERKEQQNMALQVRCFAVLFFRLFNLHFKNFGLTSQC